MNKRHEVNFSKVKTVRNFVYILNRLLNNRIILLKENLQLRFYKNQITVLKRI